MNKKIIIKMHGMENDMILHGYPEKDSKKFLRSFKDADTSKGFINLKDTLVNIRYVICVQVIDEVDMYD